MNCLKCGYTRKAGDTTPDTQCPSCGVFYAKVAEAPVLPRGPVIYTEKPGFWTFGKVAMAAAVVGGIYSVSPYLSAFRAPADAGNPEAASVSGGDLAQASITMYSLTTCGYCAALRRTFEANGVPFREVFVDTDESMAREMFGKLQNAGYTSTAIGTPTLEVNGRMMPNNPPYDEIIRQARKKTSRG